MCRIARYRTVPRNDESGANRAFTRAPPCLEAGTFVERPSLKAVQIIRVRRRLAPRCNEHVKLRVLRLRELREPDGRGTGRGRDHVELPPLSTNTIASSSIRGRTEVPCVARFTERTPRGHLRGLWMLRDGDEEDPVECAGRGGGSGWSSADWAASARAAALCRPDARRLRTPAASSQPRQSSG